MKPTATSSTATTAEGLALAVLTETIALTTSSDARNYRAQMLEWDTHKETWTWSNRSHTMGEDWEFAFCHADLNGGNSGQGCLVTIKGTVAMYEGEKYAAMHQSVEAKVRLFRPNKHQQWRVQFVLYVFTDLSPIQPSLVIVDPFVEATLQYKATTEMHKFFRVWPQLAPRLLLGNHHVMLKKYVAILLPLTA